MERVYYHLERSLPTLQLLDTHQILNEKEANVITSQRNRHERNLIRRHARSQDFLDYAQWEGDVHELISLRIEDMDLPPSLSTKIRAAYLAHTISIFERAVRRLKYDVDLWRSYIEWSVEKGMRKVAARVMARALSLHPSHVPLWIAAASFELNSNGSPTAARTLLLRGIRMNRTAWRLREESDATFVSHGSKKRAAASIYPPASAKRVKSDGPSGTTNGAGSDPRTDAPTLHPAKINAPLLRLWIEYFRMELVFLERLRRRKMVLGLDGRGEPSEQSALLQGIADGQEGEAEDMAIQAVTVPTDTSVPDEASDEGAAAAASAAVDSRSKTSILDGAIPLALLRTAVGLPSDKASDGLPPDMHLAFLISVLELLREFPLLPSSTGSVTNGRLVRDEKKSIKARLLDATYDAVQTRFPDSGAVSNLLACKTVVFAQPLWSHEEDQAEELAEHAMLRDASKLQATYSPPVDGLLSLLKRLIDTSSTRPEELPVRISCVQLRFLLDVTAARAPSEVPALVQQVVKLLEGQMKASAGSEEVFIAALEMVESLRRSPGDQSTDTNDDPLAEENLQLYIAAVHARVLKRGRSAASLGAENRAIDARWRRAEFAERLRKLEKHDGSSAELKHLEGEVAAAITTFAKAQRGQNAGLGGRQMDDERAACAKEMEALWNLRLRNSVRLALELPKTEKLWSQALEDCPASKAMWRCWAEWVDARVASQQSEGNGRKVRKWALGAYEAAVLRTAAQLSLSSLFATQGDKQAVHDLVLERYLSCAGKQQGASAASDSSSRERRDASVSRALQFVRTKAFGSARFYIDAVRQERLSLGLDRAIDKEAADTEGEGSAFKHLAPSSVANLETLYSILSTLPTSTSPADLVDASLARLRHLLIEKEDAALALKELHRASRALEDRGALEYVRNLKRGWVELCGHGGGEKGLETEEEGEGEEV